MALIKVPPACHGRLVGSTRSMAAGQLHRCRQRVQLSRCAGALAAPSVRPVRFGPFSLRCYANAPIGSTEDAEAGTPEVTLHCVGSRLRLFPCPVQSLPHGSLPCRGIAILCAVSTPAHK